MFVNIAASFLCIIVDVWDDTFPIDKKKKVTSINEPSVTNSNLQTKREHEKNNHVVPTPILIYRICLCHCSEIGKKV